VPVLGRNPGQHTPRDAATQHILDATAALLRGGTSFADLTVAQITERAEMSRTAFYVHFPDKRALLQRLVLDALRPVFFDPVEEHPGTSPAEAMRRQVVASMRFVRKHTDVFRAVVEAAGYDEVIHRWWRDEVMSTIVAQVRGRIAIYQETDQALPIDAKVAAEALVLMAESALYEHVRRGNAARSDQEVIDTLTTICVRAVYGAAPGDSPFDG
jgi:AcrR family transcriptional regulator